MGRLSVITIVIVMLLAAAPTLPQRSLTPRQRLIVSDWKRLAESIARENAMVDDLTKNFQLNPPWRVVDARAPEQRAELIDHIIAEHKLRIDLLAAIRQADKESE